MKIPATWTFESPEVAAEFDQHVREQLPWYDLVSGAIGHIARHYVPAYGQVYDIGASQGNVGRVLRPLLSDRKADLISIEPSPDMCARFQGPGDLVCARAEEYGFEPFDFAVTMLTLMFVPPSRVPDLLARLVANIKPGGALVLVERTLPPPGYMSVVTSRLTLAAKWEMGAAADQIIEKELSLSGVQRPVDPETLTRLGAVEWFRFGDFAGYVIEAAA